MDIEIVHKKLLSNISDCLDLFLRISSYITKLKLQFFPLEVNSL